MITLVAQSAHSHGGQYIARLVGRHTRYTFEREFVGRKSGKRHERSEADLDSPGLYEVCDVNRAGKNHRYVFILDVGHALVAFDCQRAEAMRVARSLDEGLAFTQVVRANAKGESYEVLSVAQAKREQRQADVARSIEAATHECWGILQALPIREAKRVVLLLKKRLTPQDTTVSPAPCSSDPVAQQESET